MEVKKQQQFWTCHEGKSAWSQRYVLNSDMNNNKMNGNKKHTIFSEIKITRRSEFFTSSWYWFLNSRRRSVYYSPSRSLQHTLLILFDFNIREKEPCGDGSIPNTNFVRECSTQKREPPSAWKKTKPKSKKKKMLRLAFFINRYARIYRCVCNQTQFVGYKIKDPNQNYLLHFSQTSNFQTFSAPVPV